MGPTEIHLNDEQASALRRLAAERGTTVADVLRDAVEALLRSESRISVADLRARAAAVAGKFASGASDVAEDHDRHLEDSFRK